MREHALGERELRFAELIWAHEPVASGELVRLAERALNWKKSTTYTMLRRLCERGLFENDGGTVRARMSEAQLRAAQSERFVEDAFGGRCRALWRRSPPAARSTRRTSPSCGN